MPRLRKRVQATELADALEQISHDHEQMEEALEKLIPRLHELAEATNLEAFREVGALSQKLRSILEPHLLLEEKHLLPFARMVLTAEDLEAMAKEIAQRQELRDKGLPAVVKV
jgi:hemerythrin-like domain-containing protein